MVFTCALTAYAQSGRRSTSKPVTPAPPVSAPEKVPAKPEAPKLQFLVSADDPSPFSSVPSFYSYTVLDTCIDRLGDAPGIVATPAARRMNRAEAIKTAKEEKERYVVWLQVSDDLGDSSSQVRNTAQKLYVYYFVFEPVTGKVKASGRTYQGSYKVGNVGISGPASRNAVYSEYEVKQSAREAAEKVLAAFQIKLSDGGRWPLD